MRKLNKDEIAFHWRDAAQISAIVSDITTNVQYKYTESRNDDSEPCLFAETHFTYVDKDLELQKTHLARLHTFDKNSKPNFYAVDQRKEKLLHKLLSDGIISFMWGEHTQHLHKEWKAS